MHYTFQPLQDYYACKLKLIFLVKCHTFQHHKSINYQLKPEII